MGEFQRIVPLKYHLLINWLLLYKVEFAVQMHYEILDQHVDWILSFVLQPV